MFSLSLIAFFVLPVLSISTTHNDPFRAIALKVPKNDPPICCLKPLTPVELVDDNILVSFEEWKRNQLAAAVQNESPQEQERVIVPGSQGQESNQDPILPHVGLQYPSPDGGVPPNPSFAPVPAHDIAPHFRIPITDRFNYANLDCSARVHASHRSAKSPSSILSSKKDRYMLSPCNTPQERQFVIVELCDDIRIDTVQLANFEFFSGVFKDFRVSLSKTSTADDWTVVSNYRAKNVRGVQSFYLPTSVRDFYRFIRLDFLSFYGNEYYCPLSILRVYGLTHLEEWKWDMWQVESNERSERSHQTIASVTVSSPAIYTRQSKPLDTSSASSSEATSIAPPSSVSTSLPSSTTSTLPSPTSSPSLAVPLSATTPPHVDTSTDTTLPEPLGHLEELPDSRPSSSQVPSSSTHQDEATPSGASQSPVVDHTATTTASQPSSSQSSIVVSTNSHSQVIHSPQAPALPTAPHAQQPVHSQPHGESIYRTIMNRLTAVENNQTLYMKYVEQQHVALKQVIKRLGEDVGRLEGITRAQGLTIQRVVDDWDKQRYQMQMETRDILRRMENLSEEIILEKRLGVAQLCLLLAVLVFLGLTRGSRAPDSPVLLERQSLATRQMGRTANISGGFREWSRCHLSLSLSGDSRGEKAELDGLQHTEVEGLGDQDAKHSGKKKVNKFVPSPLDLKHLDTDSDDENLHGLAFPMIASSSTRKSSTLREHNRPLSSIDLNHQYDIQPVRRRKSSINYSLRSTHRSRTRTISNPYSAAGADSRAATPTALTLKFDDHHAPPTALRTAPLPSQHVLPTHTRRSTQYVRPVTPTKGHFVFAGIPGSSTSRPHNALQRSHSQGGSRPEITSSAVSQMALAGGRHVPVPIPQSTSWSHGVVPKSAKRWARSAHLHEVKSVRVVGTRVGRLEQNGNQISEIGKGKGKERLVANERDVFSESFSASGGQSTDLRGSLRTSGHETAINQEQDVTNSALFAVDLSYPSRVGNQDVLPHMSHAALVDDADPWIDTDSASNFDDERDSADEGLGSDLSSVLKTRSIPVDVL